MGGKPEKPRYKVAFYTDSPAFGGAEKALLQLMEGIDRQCWNPVLLHTGSTGLAPLIEKAEKLKIPCRLAPDMPLGLQGAVQMPRLIFLLKKERPDVFHAHLSWPLDCKWALAGAVLSGIPAVVATEQLYVEAPYTRLAASQQRLLARRIHYIAVSQAVANRLQEVFRIPEARLRVIPNAFSNHTSIPVQAESRRVVLCVARLDPQKGLGTLLQAAASIPDAVFLLAGEGSQRYELEAQAAALGLQERVHFLGFREDIPALLAMADVFVLPSLYEGMPLSLLEAMSAGKAVVASAIPGVDEVVKHGETGLLVPPADPGRLAAEIRNLLDNPGLATRLGQAARQFVQCEYSQDTMVKRVCGVYEELLEKHGAA
ncbi:MAG: glycosyltransferase [Omnitrophica WOR_2 bacterium]